MVELFALLLALVVIGAAALILAPLRSSTAEGRENGHRTGTEDDPEVANLIAAREAALQTIRELDFDYRLGNLAEDDYRDLRERHKLHAIALLKATQQTLGQGPRDGRTADSADPVDLEIERAVQAHRHARRMADPVSGAAAGVATGGEAGANGASSLVETACPDCGRLLRPDDRFCSGCGAATDGTRESRVAGRESRVPSPESRAAGHESRVAGHESQATDEASEPAGSGSGSGAERAAAQLDAVSAPVQDAGQVGASAGSARGTKMTRGPRSMSPSRSTRDARPATRNSLKWLVGGVIVALGLIGGTAWIVLGTRSALQDQRPVAQLPAQVQNVHGLTWSPGGSEADGQTQEGLVILGHHAGALASEDGGRTWRPFTAADPTGEVRAIAGQGTVIYLAGQARLLKSTDGGRAWAPLSHDLPGTQIEALAVAPEDPAGVYAVVPGQGLFHSGDGGSHWEQVSPTLPRNVSGLAVASNGWLYLATFDQGVLTSRDGRAWAPASGFVTGALPTLQIAALAHDAQSGDSYLTPTGDRLTGALYAGTDRGLFKSVDGGTSWLRLPLETDVQALAIHPARSDTLLVVDSRGRVFRSEDRGLTWK